MRSSWLASPTKRRICSTVLQPVVEGGVDSRQHGVERLVEPPDLGVARRALEALAEVAGGEPGRRLLDLAQRRERGCHEQAGQGAAEHDDGEREEQEDQRELADDLFVLTQVVGDDDGACPTAVPSALTSGNPTASQWLLSRLSLSVKATPDVDDGRQGLARSRPASATSSGSLTQVVSPVELMTAK